MSDAIDLHVQFEKECPEHSTYERTGSIQLFTASYVFWLESRHLAEREKVTRLTAENERMRGALEKVHGIVTGDDDGPADEEQFFEAFADMETICEAVLSPTIKTLHEPVEETITEIDNRRGHVKTEIIVKPTLCRWKFNSDRGGPALMAYDTGCKKSWDGKRYYSIIPDACPYCGLPVVEVKDGE